MKIFVIFLFILASLISNAQVNNGDKCTLFRTLLSDSLILKKVIFNEPGNEEIYVIDTSQLFFDTCIISPIFGKKINIVHKRSDIGTKNIRLMLEIQKVVVLPKNFIEVHVFYKTRNYYAIIKYKKRGNSFIHYTHKTGYY